MTTPVQSTMVSHGYKARRDDHNRGWIAEFFGPDGIGFRTVLNPDGTVKMHGSKSAAATAAMIGLCEALTERSKARSARAKVFQVFGAGKARRVASVGVFR